MTPELIAHPVADLLPMMTATEQAALEADIRINGQREDIVLLNGRILDGRNRYLILKRLGLPIRTVPADPKAAKDPVAYVYSKALHRDMTDSQKACAAVVFADMVANMPDTEYTSMRRMVVEQREQRSHIDRHVTRDIAGHLFGVSGRYVAYARKLRSEAPDLFEQCRAGRPVSSARSELRRRTNPAPDPTIQAKALAAIESAVKSIVVRLRAITPRNDEMEDVTDGHILALQELVDDARIFAADVTDSTGNRGMGVSPMIPP